MIDTIKKDFNHFLYNSLNDPQRSAVLHKEKAQQIIAGAGSGKTRVITSRIAHLVINENINPRSIVALTFTNKAAGEMKERLIHTFQSHYKLPFIGTFHSYCLLLLRTNATLLASPNFSILDADDQEDLIKSIMKKYALAKHVTASQIVYQISQYKNKSFVNDKSIKADLQFAPLMKDVYLEYESEKARSHALDFDDLILQILQLLTTNEAFKLSFQKKIRHILVDEYQDTSHVQHSLLRAMALEPASTKDSAPNKLAIDSLCAVGDEDQSIYSWRGATVANMLKFQQDFAPVTIVKIEQNYRSAQPILEAANQVIANNRLRNPKNLWSTRSAKNRILHLYSTSGDHEAKAISTLIKCAPKKKRSDIAILYRTHFQSRSIEESLIHHAIPYKIVGGIRFYERKEIKDLLAYLRLVINPYDKISLLRIINTPSRGLGAKFEEQLLIAWNRNPLFDFIQLLTWMTTDPDGGVTGNKKIAVQDFLKLYTGLEQNQHPSKTLDFIVNEIAYLSYLNDNYDPREAQDKVENVQEFMQAVIVFEQKHANSLLDKTNTVEINTNVLEAFLHEVALLQEKIEEDSPTERIHMMTLHAAKGLEFDTVIMSGLEEGLLPSSKSLNTNEALEEERRLMYVGMTRAKEHLILSSAQSRVTFGQFSDQVISRFVSEIPKGLMQTIDLDEVPIAQAIKFFEQWIGGTSSASFQPSQLPGHMTAPTANPYSAHSASAPSKTVRPATSRPTVPSKPSVSKASSSVPWIKNQTVHHEKFGTGIIVEVQRADDSDFYITALFSAGKKKVLSRFLEKKSF